MLQDGDLPDTLRVAEHVRLFSSYYPSPRPIAETLALAGLDRSGPAPLRRTVGRPEAPRAIRAGHLRSTAAAVRRRADGGPGRGIAAQFLARAAPAARRGHRHRADHALPGRSRCIGRSRGADGGGRVLAEDTPAGIKSRAAGKRVRARSGVGQRSRWRCGPK